MSNDTPSGASESMWNSRWTVAAAVFLVAIVAVAIIIAVTTRESQQDEVVSEPTAASPAAPVSDSYCGIPNGDQSLPTTAAPESTWVLRGKVGAPADPAIYGPGVEDGGLASCYAHSPVGALYAGANMYAQGSMPELARRNILQNVAPGVGKDVALAELDESAVGGDVSVQFAGFQILEYSPERTSIDFAARNSTGAVISLVTDLVWVDGDWKVEVQDNGQPLIPPRQIPDLGGYLLWSGA